MSRDRDDDFFDDDDFLEDDLFADKNANGFEFDSDEDTGLNDFENDLDFDSFDEDEDFASDVATEERSGPSRTFIFLAVVMIIIMLAGLGVVIFLATRDQGPSERDLTATSIVAFNSTQQSFLEATNEQATVNAIELATQVVLDNQATETAVVVQGTETAEAIVAQTQDAESAVATQTAEQEAVFARQTRRAENDAATQTAEAQGTAVAVQPTEEPSEETDEPVDAIDPGGVALTATALFEILNTPIAGTIPPAGGDGDSTTGGVPTARPPALPETGLLDGDSSAGGVGVIMLMAFGLIGIIFGARRLRSMNK